MGGIIDKITEFIKELLQGWVLTNFETMFTDVNDKVGTIAGEVSKTPSTWNSGIFDMIKTLSDNVMIPIAGMIISFVLVYELISMVIDKNNLHDFNTAIFIRFFMKACIAVMLLSKTFDIVMAVFDVGSHIVNSAAAAISGETSIDVSSTLQTMFNEQFSEMSIGELLGLGMETMIVSLCMKIMSVLITVILYGRMIEIYLYVSVAPVPCATVTNREWGTIGTNYFKGLCAIAFQGFFMMVCVAIYAVLVAGVAVSDNLHTALWSVAAYTVILCFSLFKTGSLSKSIWNVSLMLGFLREANTSKSVIDIYDELYHRLGGQDFRKLFPVILTDNGSEFSNPRCIENGPDGKGFQRTRIYYCNPSAPYQKAEIEVGHEFIRRILPKGRSFDELTQADVELMMNHINSYRRKKLNGKSPYEAFSFYYGEDLAERLRCHEVAAKDINLTARLLKK